VPHNRTGRRISAADGQALQTAQQIMNEVRSAYQQEPNAMLIADGTLNPLELIVVDGQTARYYRIPVTCNDDGTFDFGSPIPVTGPSSPGTGNPQTGGTPAQASRGLSARDRQLIQAAVDRGAIPAQRAAFYAAEAAAGRDISQLAQLEGDLLPAGGAVAASAAPRDADAEYPEYRTLFGPPDAGQRMADDREVAARAAALTADLAYENLFGAKASAAPAPVAAATAGHASQHGQGGAARTRWRVHAPLVSLRVPQDPNVAAGADPGTTSWRTIELRGGDLVPEHAHPADVERLRHQKNRLGPLIKPW